MLYEAIINHSCDSRFSKISQFLKEGSLREYIKTTDDIVRIVKQKQSQSNDNRFQKGKKSIETHQMILEILEKPNSRNK